jgi:hypothetical protein
MGHLKYIVVGGKDAIQRFVTTPFLTDPDLCHEIVECWSPHHEGNSVFTIISSPDKLGKKISQPRASVLYIVAHSSPGVAVIGGRGGETWDARKLADWLTKSENPLPKTMLAVKIWACYSGSNGFARDLAEELSADGYNTIVVGYSKATGGRGDLGDKPHKHVFELDPGGARGQLIGRAKHFQKIFHARPK